MTDTAGSVHFPCPGCGAPEMVWNAAVHKMVCPYCQMQADVPQAAPAAPAQQQEVVPGATAPASPVGAHQERTLAEGLALIQQGGGGGLGAQVQTTRCQTCGATVSFAGVEIASRCDFCGSDQVLQQESNRQTIRPQSLVPFKVEQAVATKTFGQWLGSLWFRPNDLKKMASVGDIHGVYIPYWTFDAHVASQWTAESGYYYYVTESYWTTENGKQVQRTRQVRKIRWQPANGWRNDQYDDVLVVASRGLPRQLADKMKTFDTSALVPYDPRYLAGWRAEEYVVNLDEGWVMGQTKIGKEQVRRCGRDVPGDTHRNLNVQNQFSNETFKHVLMPIWISSYRYKDKAYRFLVNGQTGEVTGEAPWSWIKITLFTLMVIAIVVGIVFLVTQNR